MGQNLTGKLIKNTYEDLVQISGSILTDGTGSDITSLTITASFASQAGTAGYAGTAGFTPVATSASWANQAGTAGYSSTAGFTPTATSASFASQAGSAGFATSASQAENANTVYVSQSVGAGLANILLGQDNGGNATSNVSIDSSGNLIYDLNNSTLYSFAFNGNLAGTASNATSASFANQAGTSGFATTASFALTASSLVGGVSLQTVLDTGNTATQDINLTGDITATNLTASNATFSNLTATSASIGYLQTVTGSVTQIGDAFILLNTSDTTRYAGLLVEDSGSAVPINYTASWFFDSQTNDWNYEYTSGSTDYGVAMFGPTYNTKGSPTYPANNKIQKGTGTHHLADTNISDDGTKVSINSNTEVTGSLTVSAGITGSLAGTASFASQAGTSGFAVSASFAATASYVNLGTSATASFTGSTWTFNHNLNSAYVVVDCYDSNNEEIIPQTIDLVTANQAVISFPVSVQGTAVASLGNGVIVASITNNTTNNNFNNSPINTVSSQAGNFISGSVQKLTANAATTYNLHVSQSGPYWVDFTGLASGTTANLNIYMYVDSFATMSANSGSMVIFSAAAGTGNYVSYRTIVTGSGTYWATNTVIGNSTTSIARNATLARRDFNNAAVNPTAIVKTTDGDVIVYNPGSPLANIQYNFTGNQGTPIP